MTLVERAAEWPKQWLREGREQVLRKAANRGSNRVLTSNEHSCAGWRRHASVPIPPLA